VKVVEITKTLLILSPSGERKFMLFVFTQAGL